MTTRSCAGTPSFPRREKAELRNAEAQGVYKLIGAPEKLLMVDADDGQGYSKPRLLAAYDPRLTPRLCLRTGEMLETGTGCKIAQGNHSNV